jgi:ATP-binding cassette subfamily B (MDR/TAP) protein 1
MVLITSTNVTLRYPSRPGIAALNSISLHMEPGKAYAFCGTSGAGKSSIMAVLERYYEIAEGSVMLDGRDIRGMDVDELRGMMGYVSQEAVLFEDSVKWNLLVRPPSPCYCG